MADRRQHIPDERGRAANTPTNGADGGTSASGTPSEEAKRRSRIELIQKYVIYGLGGILGLALLAIVVLVLVLQTEWGREQGRRFIVDRMNTLVDGAEFRAERLEGNFLGRIALLNLDLVKADGEHLARADTFAAEYSLLPLIRNTLKLKNLDLINPRIWMEQQPDGSWDLFNVIAQDDSARVDTTESWATRLLIELDHLYIGDGRVDARFYPTDRDSVLLVRDLYMDMGNAQFGRDPIFELDSLVARFSPPAQEYWADLRVGGALNDSLLVVDGFDLSSPRSSVRSEGSLALPGADSDLVSDIDFSLEATPLSFDDINAFVPGLRRGASVDLDVDVGGRQDLLEINADARFSDGGTMLISGAVSPDEPRVSYDLTGTVRSFDLSILTSNPSHESSINTNLRVDLAGIMLDALDGTADATIYETRIGSLVFDRTTLESEWEKGRARIDARGGLREMAFSLAGHLRPFDESPSYNVSGRVSNFNLANFTGGDQQTDINATLRVDGRGFDQNAALTADVQVAPSTINDYRIEYGVMDLAMEDGRMNFGTRFRFPDGQLYAQGQANFNEDPITYSVGRGRIENLDLAALLGTDAPSAIHGTFSMSGTGTDPNTMSLRGDVDLFDSRYGDVTIAAADLNVSLQNGTLRANTAADLAEAGDLAFVAQGNPFADQPTISVTSGEFRSLDLGPLTQNPDLSTDLTGTAVFTIRGFDAPQMAVEGRVDLDPSRFNNQRINSAYAVLDLNRGDLAFNASVEMPEGQARVVGSGQPFRDVPTYSIDDGRFTNIDLAAFTGNEGLESALSGTFSGQGRGFDLETMVFQGRLQVAPSVVNQQQINRILAQVEVQRGRLDVGANIDLPDGDVQLAASMDLLDEVPTYEIDRSTFQNLNIGAITGNADLQTNLTGALEARGVGMDPETMTLDGTLFLSDSQINEQVIDTATVTGTLTGGVLAFDARMVAPEGISDLEGSVDFSGETLAYAVTEGQLQGIDVGALTGNPNLRTNLTAWISLQGVGTDPETMNLSGTIDFSRSEINQATITEGMLEASLQDGLLALDGTIFFTDGIADVQAQARLFDPAPVYQATGTLRNVDLGAILGTDTLRSVLTASFDLAGEGFEPETMTLRGRIDSDTSRYQDARIAELRAEFTLEAGFLQVDTLVLQSNFADVEAGGSVALFGAQAQYGSDFTFIADIYQAEPIRPFIPAETFALDAGHIEGRVYGRPGNLQFDVLSDVSSLVYNDIRISGLDGRFAGEITPEGTLSIGEFDAEIDYFALPFITVRSSNVNVTYQGDDLLFNGTFEFDDGQSAEVEGRLDLREDVRAATLESLNLTLADQQWELLLPATITYGDAYRISNFLLVSDDGQVAIDGIIDPHGSQALVLTIESFRFGSIADLVGYRGLAGTLDGELALLGPAHAPIMEGELTFDVISQGRRVGDLDMEVRYDSLRLNIDALLTHVDGGSLTVNGYVPTDLSLAPDTAMVGEGLRVRTQQTAPESEVNFTVLADSFGINWIDPFLDPTVVQDVRGILSGDVLVTGSFNAPVLDGELSLSDGRIRLPEFNVTYQNIELDATLAENRMDFTNARMTSGGGTLRADGTVYLTELTLGEFDINARLDAFQAVRNNEYQITTSGNLQLAGTTREPVVTGSLQLVQTDIYLNQATSSEIIDVELTDRDIRVLEERFGYQVTAADTAISVFYQNLTLDLTVEMGRNTWVRQRSRPQMAIQFEGSLDVQKEPGAEPQIFGTIEVIEQRSYIDQFSRRFNITDGTLTFNGDPTNFVMDVTAEYQVKDRFNPGQAQVVITLGLRGRLDDLEFTLGSNPTMSETDILSYIATGQPAGQSLQLADASDLFVSGGAGLAINEVATVLEGIAGEGLGLDVIEIQHDGLRGAVLIAGKYVSPRVYVGVSQPVSFSSSNPLTDRSGAGRRSQTEATLEYEIFDWLLLRLSGGTTALRGLLLWEHAY